MKKYAVILICLLTLIVAATCSAEGDQDLIQVKGVLYLKSSVSAGERCPEELIKLASEADIKAVFLTEYLMPRWQYGIFPFRNIIRRTVEFQGLLRYGVKKYAREVAELNKDLPDITVFMASRVVPFYYWTGDPFEKNGLTIHDWDVQFIVTGLDARGYAGIPTVSNGKFLRYGLKSVLLLWPIALIIAGIMFLKIKNSRFYLPNALCWLLIITGIAFALHNYPFKAVKYDQYHGKAGVGPYQDVIDYVNKKGGMVFWSNPEVVIRQDVGPVISESLGAMDFMLEARDYTGFCCFYEGYRQVGGPGGVWDTVLEEYCSGYREAPVWTIGELTYHGCKDPGGKKIDEVQTVFLVPSDTRENILRAMRSGSMYAVRKSKICRLQLDSVEVENSSGQKAGMGEELMSGEPVTIRFKVSWEGEPKKTVTAKLIRNGMIIKEFFITDPCEFEYKDDLYEPGQKIYYRLDIRGKYPSMLFSNPIFVEFK